MPPENVSLFNTIGVSPDLEFAHNTDLNPPADYLASVPRLERVLRNPALVEMFECYDALANSHQSTLRNTGTASLCLASLGLAGITAKLLLAALGKGMPPALTICFELSALSAIALALGPWFARTRGRWLTARFVTEQIRQWHFQLLLDGDLVSKACSSSEEFEETRARRWAQFTARFASAEGARISFVDGENMDLGHPQSTYKEAEMANEVFRAYADLRFRRQLAYFKLSRHRFAVRDDWSESIARWTLFTAVLLAAGQIFFAITPQVSAEVRHDTSMWLGASALWLVILSGAIRVYRAATALSQQRERYDSTWVRLVTLKAAFDGATSIPSRLKLMRDVEIAEVEECREFLRQMCRASYLL